MKSRYTFWLAVLILFLVIVLHPAAKQNVIASSGKAYCPDNYAPGIVLVGFHSPPSTPHLPWGEGWDEEEIFTIADTEVWSLNVPIGEECTKIESLRQHPNVAFAELDYAVRSTSVITPNDPRWVDQWGPAMIDAPVAWGVTTGTSDAIIAIVDTGLYLDHEDLAENLWRNLGEIPDNNIDDDGNGKTDDFWGWHFYHEKVGVRFVEKEDNNVVDDNGHGTHVAGIAGARINNNVGIAGIAGGARLMTVKVLDASGEGWYSDLAKGIVYAVDNGARIINLSTGGDQPSDLLQEAVEYAHTHGAVVVAASGNNGGDVLYPASYEHVLAVGATDQSDQRTSFSNHGPQMDVAAPGVSIYSTGYQGDYFSQSGTSMAVPHVTGLAGLIVSACPNLMAEQVSEVITATALDANHSTYPGWDEYLGWGRVDAMSALSEVTDLTAPTTYGVGVEPLTAGLSGTAGGVVTYTLTVSNTGSVSDTFSVDLSGNTWETVPSVVSLGPLGAGATDTLRIYVSIPLTATEGSTDAVDVTLVSMGDPSQAVGSVMVTTALWDKFYLPLLFYPSQ